MHNNKIFLLLTTLGTFCKSDIISYYEEIIKNQINSSINYKLPEDASDYKPTEEIKKDFGTYDFIIIGAGSSGTVLANRLSKIKEWNILLLEAGSQASNITNVPNMFVPLQWSDYNWGYESIPQTTACLDMVDRKCTYPRGKGIGGSTLINGLVYSRGNRHDFDKWAQQGNPGWSYNKLLPYFKISENFVHSDKEFPVDYEYHGYGGDLNVEFPLVRHPLLNYWLEAHKEEGYEIVDYNGRKQIGGSLSQLNTKHGIRDHGGNAFINPIKERKNLKIQTESFVTKIIVLDNKRVESVEFVYKGQYYTARTRKEVILSAGAIGSPQLLMLSGVGPAKHLTKLGIPVVEDLEVGSKLRDHPAFYGLYFNTNFNKTYNSLHEDVAQFLNGYGTLAVPPNTGIGFYQTKFGTVDNYPDLEILMHPVDGFFDTILKTMSLAGKSMWQHLLGPRSFIFDIIALHSRSTGTVRLRSSSPFDYPLIDSRYLSDPENIDIDTLYEGIQLALKLINTEAFKTINASIVQPPIPACQNENYLSKSYWYCVLRQFTSDLFHPQGTCPMGPDPKKGAVVDSQAKLHGIKNLRVVDASIFPFTFSGHPNAVCVMIGERISDLIKRQYL